MTITGRLRQPPHCFGAGKANTRDGFGPKMSLVDRYAEIESEPKLDANKNNHISEMASFDTGDQEVGCQVFEFVSPIR